MQTVSALYTQIMEGGGWHEVKLDVAGVVYDMDKLITMQTSHALYDGAVSVGNALAGTIDVQLIANTNTIPAMAELRPYVRAVDDTRESEWLPRGIYWIDTREYDKETGILTLSGFDAMLKGEQDYMSFGEQGVWPQVDRNVLCDIADRLELGRDTFAKVQNPTGNPKEKGWYWYSVNDRDYYLTADTTVKEGKNYYLRSNSGIDQRTLDIITRYYQVQYPGAGETAYTVREVLGFIGAMYAGNWTMNEQGQLRLVVLGDIPPETNYLITQDEYRITLGGDRLVMT